MFIKDLQARQTNVDVEGDVLEVSDVREFSKFGKAGRVANAFIRDGTGKVKLSLWNEQIDQVKVGDKVKITKGYVGEFQGELQLTTGKFGALEVTEGGADSPAEPAAETPVEPAAPTPEPTPPKPEGMPDESPEKPSVSVEVEEEDLS